MENFGEYLQFAKDIAKRAGQIMLHYFQNKDNISQYKKDKTVVSLADKEINHYLIEQVKQKYPNHAVDGEEEQFGQSKYLWVCDPIDGTAQFVRNIPVAVFSLALVIDGVPVVGVVNDPFTNNLYYAAKGCGAYRNNDQTKLQVSQQNFDGMRSIAQFDMAPGAVVKYNLWDVMKALGEKTYTLAIGSAIHAGVAVADGQYEVSIWPCDKNVDIAAIKVLVEEAGGIVRDIFGNEQRYDQLINGAIISNQAVYAKTLTLLKKHLN